MPGSFDFVFFLLLVNTKVVGNVANKTRRKDRGSQKSRSMKNMLQANAQRVKKKSRTTSVTIYIYSVYNIPYDISFSIKIDLFSFLAFTNKKLLGIVRGKKSFTSIYARSDDLLRSFGRFHRLCILRIFFVRCLFALAVCACDTIASTGSPSQSSELVRFLFFKLLLFLVFVLFVDGAGDRKRKKK